LGLVSSFSCTLYAGCIALCYTVPRHRAIQRMKFRVCASLPSLRPCTVRERERQQLICSAVIVLTHHPVALCSFCNPLNKCKSLSPAVCANFALVSFRRSTNCQTVFIALLAIGIKGCN